MKNYEIMYIIKPDLETEETKQVIENLTKVFTDLQAQVKEHKEIGLKDLAYEIDHFKKGYYVWQLVSASPEVVKEFNRVVRITEEVIRFIVIKEGE